MIKLKPSRFNNVLILGLVSFIITGQRGEGLLTTNLHCRLQCLISTGRPDTSRSHRALTTGEWWCSRAARGAQLHNLSCLSNTHRLHREEETRRAPPFVRPFINPLSNRSLLPGPPACPYQPARRRETTPRASVCRRRPRTTVARAYRREGGSWEGRSAWREKRARLSVLFPDVDVERHRGVRTTAANSPFQPLTERILPVSEETIRCQNSIFFKLVGLR